MKDEDVSSRASAHFRQMIKSSSLLSVKEIVKPYLPRSWLYGSNGDIYWLNFKEKKKKMPYLRKVCLKGMKGNLWKCKQRMCQRARIGAGRRL